MHVNQNTLKLETSIDTSVHNANVPLSSEGGPLFPNIRFLEPNAMKKKFKQSQNRESGFRRFMKENHPEILKKWEKPKKQDGITENSTNNQILNRKWKI